MVEKIIRKSRLREATGVSISTIYALIARGQFPKPIPLGRKAVGWLEREVVEWQRARIAEREAGTGKRRGPKRRKRENEQAAPAQPPAV